MTSARTSRSDASILSIAILITSAAEPWIGAFSAIRSALSRRWRLSLVRSGRYRRRPRMVEVYPALRASLTMLRR